MSPRLGFHVSIAGGISNSVKNAIHLRCNAFQIFTRNPRSWAARPLDPLDVTAFRKNLSENDISSDSIIVHMPYLPNLSGPEGEIYTKSVQTLCAEVERCSILGIPFLVAHLGSHLGKGKPAGIEQLVKACLAARDVSKSCHSKSSDRKQVTILLENNAGQRNSIGTNFNELASIIDRLDDREGVFGVCLDSCHAFASGCDMRTDRGVFKMLDEFNSIIGFPRLKLIHLNDSRGDLGSNLDRHEHIGLGKIGRLGLATLVHNAVTMDLPIIMETPVDKTRSDIDNMKEVTKWITEKS